MIIEDGAGTGKKAEVIDTNELRVRATQHTEEHRVSEDTEQTYFTTSSQTSTPTLTFLTTETGDVLYLQNTSATDMIVTVLLFSADVAGGVVTTTKNVTEGSLTQNTSIVPINFNFGSGKTAGAQTEVWDETNGDGIQGLSGGDTIRSFTMPASAIAINTAGSVILPQGKSITISFNNITGDTIEFECGIRFYYDDVSG